MFGVEQMRQLRFFVLSTKIWLLFSSLYSSANGEFLNSSMNSELCVGPLIVYNVFDVANLKTVSAIFPFGLSFATAARRRSPWFALFSTSTRVDIISHNVTHFATLSGPFFMATLAMNFNIIVIKSSGSLSAKRSGIMNQFFLKMQLFVIMDEFFDMHSTTLICVSRSKPFARPQRMIMFFG